MSSSMAEHSAKMLRQQEAQQRPGGPSVADLHQSKIPFRPRFFAVQSGAESSYTSRDGFGATPSGFGATPAARYGDGSGQGVFGISQYSAEQIACFQARLSRRLGPEYITQRPGPGGGPKLSYVEGWKILSLANEVFGFNGWASTIMNLAVDFCEQDKDGRVSVGVSSIIRVTLRDGVFHEDVGYGEAINLKSRSQALEKAKKEAATDGLKRALKSFGNVLGLCLYDKDYTKEVIKIKVKPVGFKADELWRRAEFDDSLQSSESAGPSRPHPMTSDTYNTMPTPGGGRSGMLPPRHNPNTAMPPPSVPMTPMMSVGDAEFDEYGDESFLLDSNTSFDGIDMPPPALPAARPAPAPAPAPKHEPQQVPPEMTRPSSKHPSITPHPQNRPSHLAQTTPTTPAPQPRPQQQQQRAAPVPPRAVPTPPVNSHHASSSTVNASTANASVISSIVNSSTPHSTNANVQRTTSLSSTTPRTTSPSSSTKSDNSGNTPPSDKIGGFVMPEEVVPKGSAARKRAIEMAKLDAGNVNRDPLGNADSNKRQRV